MEETEVDAADEAEDYQETSLESWHHARVQSQTFEIQGLLFTPCRRKTNPRAEANSDKLASATLLRSRNATDVSRRPFRLAQLSTK